MIPLESTPPRSALLSLAFRPDASASDINVMWATHSNPTASATFGPQGPAMAAKSSGISAVTL
jgi:hypothetical protein